MRATRIRLVMVAGLWAWLVFSHATSFAETDSELKPIRDDVKKLKEQFDSFGKDLQEIKILLQQSQSPIATPTGRDVLLRVGSDRVRGDPKARITMIGFGDFECGYCENFATKTLPELAREYIT